jgi:hypothetical protein
MPTDETAPLADSPNSHRTHTEAHRIRAALCHLHAALCRIGLPMPNNSLSADHPKDSHTSSSPPARNRTEEHPRVRGRAQPFTHLVVAAMPEARPGRTPTAGRTAWT